MNDSSDNDDQKSQAGPGFPLREEIPEPLEKLLVRTQVELRGCMAWSIDAEGGSSPAQALALANSIPVRVHAWFDHGSQEHVVLTGRLTRRDACGGNSRFTICLAETLPPRYNLFSLCVGELRIHQFAPAIWRQGVVPDEPFITGSNPNYRHEMRRARQAIATAIEQVDCPPRVACQARRGNGRARTSVRKRGAGRTPAASLAIESHAVG